MMKKKLLIALTLLLSGTMVSKASYADDWNIPSADAKGRVGALMPYTRYDSETAALGGGATLKTSPTWDRKNIARRLPVSRMLTSQRMVLTPNGQ